MSRMQYDSLGQRDAVQRELEDWGLTDPDHALELLESLWLSDDTSSMCAHLRSACRNHDGQVMDADNFLALSAADRLSLLQDLTLSELAQQVASLSPEESSDVLGLTYRYDQRARGEHLAGDSDYEGRVGLEIGIAQDLIYRALRDAPEFDVYHTARRALMREHRDSTDAKSEGFAPHLPPIGRREYGYLSLYTAAYDAALSNVEERFPDASDDVKHSRAVHRAAHWIAEGSKSLHSGRSWRSPYNDTTGLTEAARLGAQAAAKIDAMRGHQNGHRLGHLARFIGKASDYSPPSFRDPATLSFKTDRLHQTKHMSLCLKALQLDGKLRNCGAPNVAWLESGSYGAISLTHRMLAEGVPDEEAAALGHAHQYRSDPRMLEQGLKDMLYSRSYAGFAKAFKYLRFLDGTGAAPLEEGAGERILREILPYEWRRSDYRYANEDQSAAVNFLKPFLASEGGLLPQLEEALHREFQKPKEERSVAEKDLVSLALMTEVTARIEGRSLLEGQLGESLKGFALDNYRAAQGSSYPKNALALLKAVGLERHPEVLEHIKRTAKDLHAQDSTGNLQLLQPYRDLQEVRDYATGAFLHSAGLLASATDQTEITSAATSIKLLERALKLKPEDFGMLSDEERAGITTSLIDRAFRWNGYAPPISFYTVRKTLNLIGATSESIQEAAAQAITQEIDNIARSTSPWSAEATYGLSKILKHARVLST